MRGDLVRILTKLLKSKTKYDGILIETTGLADPAPVAQTFFVDVSVPIRPSQGISQELPHDVPGHNPQDNAPCIHVKPLLLRCCTTTAAQPCTVTPYISCICICRSICPCVLYLAWGALCPLKSYLGGRPCGQTLLTGQNGVCPLQDFLAERLLLDAIMTVVDCKHIEQHLDDKKPEGVENEVCAIMKS